ncbi:aldo/keto reductase [Pseudolysinimonas sp.]|uniref:aldo/keto reductase n=1 Tax=Pseudolysinimonas sp. TaxID=2680009 RepID=UPI003F7D45F5
MTDQDGTGQATAGGTTGWAVLGPGGISRRFVSQLAAGGGRLAAVGSSDARRAAALATEAGATEAATGSYADALAAPGVDAVYIATVNTGHARLVLDALAAGKAVLCEKPLAPNHGTAMALIDAAERAGLPLVEAFMYRFHPLTRELLRLVRDGAIGEVRHIDATFAFRTADHTGRLYDADIAGGGILDVGGYPVTMANALAAAAAGTDVAEPAELVGSGHVGEAGVDEWAVADLVYRGGVTATVRCGTRVELTSQVLIDGSRGRIRVANPWIVQEGDPAIEIATVDDEPRVIAFPGELPYGAEAAATVAARREGRIEASEMSHADSLATARTLDRWKAAVGVRFPFEAEAADIPTVGGRPLVVEPVPPMRDGEIAGIGTRMSRLVMGVDNQPDLAHASAIFDAFVEAGGTAFDTGWVYGAGTMEPRLGRWIANRGVRNDVVVIAKGAHTPYCDPESLTRQLHESLDRLQTDYADIYMMHRDNPEIPVGEFVDVMDEHRRAGRIRVYGVSNWSLERFDEANAWARANGRHELAVLSNHFGLAEAYDVPWAGCRHVTDAASKAWLEERQVPLLPWSSQARGFFTGRARPDDRSDAELVRCYYSDDNFERLRRAEQIGGEFGVPATAVALAYVLAQPFPTFPLFGPRTIQEMRSSMLGLTIDLTPEQVAWLDLRG